VRAKYHQLITAQAIGTLVSPKALEVIVAANLGQDALRYQFGHEHFHYDSNSFAAGDAYVGTQQRLILSALNTNEPRTAWKAFGRLSHTVQDLYAHSTYVDLWLAKSNTPNPDPQEIDPRDAGILSDPRLHSGKPNILLDALLHFGLMPSWLLRRLSANSHAQMNLDGPDRQRFPYAFAAAVKRTRLEYSKVAEQLSEEQRKNFTGF
jgi:hypothetical protein